MTDKINDNKLKNINGEPLSFMMKSSCSSSLPIAGCLRFPMTDSPIG